MATGYRPVDSTPPPDPPPVVLTRLDGGLNVRDIESEIGDTQSPYMVNVNADDRGAIQKRNGQLKVYETSLGAGAVHGYWDFTKMDGTTVTLLHHGTKLYTQSGSNQPVEIYSGLAGQKGTAFVFGDRWYYKNGTDFIYYDGVTVGTVASIAYVPLFTLGRSPDGGESTVNESLNLLINKWTDSFSPDGTATEFQLSFDDLAADAVTGEQDTASGTVTLVEGVDFTVDRPAGKVTFGSPPAAGTNTVRLTAAKDGLTDPTLITNHKRAVVFGGSNDTRVFLTGDDSNPAAVYWCGVMDPTYWPEDNFNLIGSDADKNTAFAVLYNQLILFKERSIYRIEYDTIEGKVVYPSYPVNSQIGCDMPETVQLIDNNVAFCNTYLGPHLLLRTDIRDERNVKPIGGNIIGAPYRPGLLDEAEDDLKAATSVDFDNKYHICVGSKVWLWDYGLSPYMGDENGLKWFYYEDVNANCWLVRGREVYFGDRDNGIVQKFINNYNDNGNPINAVWRSKLFYFNLSDWLKNIFEVYFRTRATNTQISIKYLNDNGETLATKTLTSSTFSWASFAWDTFTWAVVKFFPPVKLKPKVKKVTYFQIEFSNNRLNENLSILDLKIYYSLVRQVK